MDMPAIEELTDDRLRELSAAKPSDLDLAKAKVADIEAKFSAAKAAHDKNFPRGVQMFPDIAARERASLAAIAPIEDSLKWARRRLDLIENRAKAAKMHAAAIENPVAQRLFEITNSDGRKSRQSALNVETLRARLQKD